MLMFHLPFAMNSGWKPPKAISVSLAREYTCTVCTVHETCYYLLPAMERWLMLALPMMMYSSSTIIILLWT